MRLWFFNWPSFIGGADTKVAHLLTLLRERHEITVVPNAAGQINQAEWRGWLERLGVAVSLVDDLPERCDGWAISFCNSGFLNDAVYLKALERGMKVIWSNEMMWNFPTELGALCLGRIHTVLYTSPVQRRVLEPGYRAALFAEAAGSEEEGGDWGVIRGAFGGVLRWVVTGNYVDPEAFPFRERGLKAAGEPLVIGRVSRPDPDKFPPDFPESYTGLGLNREVTFRVLGWSEQMASRWPESSFAGRWDLLPAGSVPVVDFLDTLDLFVYDLGPRFSESWGRAVVEAMLSGVVPLVPAEARHHLRHLVPHGEGGFLCESRDDFGRYARLLQDNPARLREMSRAARRHAETVLCRKEDHLAVWSRVFSDDW